MATSSTSDEAAQGSRSLRFFIIAAAAVIITLGMRELSWLIGPILLAALIVVVMFPVYTWLIARKVPRSVAMVALVLSIFGVLFGLVAIVLFSLVRLGGLVPQYSDQLRGAAQDLTAYLKDQGFGAEQARGLLEGIDVNAIARWLAGYIPSLAGIATMLILVATVLVFLSIEATQMSYRAHALRTNHPATAAALHQAIVGTRKFLGVTTVFAVIVGVLNTIFLLIVDVPLAPLWGLLAAVCNYIPYLGFIVGMAPPALLALVIHGWQAMVVVVIVYVVLNFIVTSIVPAKFIGDAVGLSVVVEVLCIAFWAWVLGPIGAILAVPLTVFVKAVLVDADPAAAWLSGFLSSAKQVRASVPSRDDTTTSS